MAPAAKRGPTVPPRLQRVVDAIQERYRPERIILFGSHAWGTPGPDSDVDLLVIKESEEGPLRRSVEVLRLIQREKRGIPMDVLVFTPSEIDERLAQGDPFIAQVLREGVVLYAAA